MPLEGNMKLEGNDNKNNKGVYQVIPVRADAESTSEGKFAYIFREG